jgi:hypothetical protein
MVVNPVSAYHTALDGEVAAVVTALASRNAGFRQRLEAAGLETADLRTVADLDRLPIVTKDQVMDMQRASPPFGGLLSDDATLRRVYQSPGPIYEPEPNLDDPWRFARALSAAGFGPDDVVLNAFGYHLSPAGAMFDEACQALGAALLPAGVGNKDMQVQACLDRDAELPEGAARAHRGDGPGLGPEAGTRIRLWRAFTAVIAQLAIRACHHDSPGLRDGGSRQPGIRV